MKSSSPSTGRSEQYLCNESLAQFDYSDPMPKPLHRARVTAVFHDIPGVTSIDFAPGLAPRSHVDDHVKILLPPPGAPYRSPVPIPAPGSPAPLLRTYTRRRYDPATGAWGIDVLDLGHGGPGSAWAGSVRPGDEVTVRGPGGHWQMPEHPGTVWMVGDAVAMPAISNALEALPAGSRAVVLLEGGGRSYPLPERPEARIVDIPVTSGGSALVDAVRRLRTPDQPWWAFAHGQAEMIRPLRRHLRIERGLARERLLLSAYWIAGRDAEGWRGMKPEFNRAMEAESGD